MLDLSQLRSFVEVAERGTVSSAAAALAYSGPAVSLQVAKLERELGTSLFDRVGGRLRLNPQGRKLLPLAQRMLDLAEEARQVGDTVDRLAPVVVAGFASALAGLVAPIVGRPDDSLPRIELREAEDRAALRDLGLGHVDIALVQDYDGLATTRSDRYHHTVVLKERLRLVTPPTYEPSVTPADLAATAWLVNGRGTRCEAATRLILDRAGIDPPITGAVADNHALLRLVAAGHGVTIVPELVLAHTAHALTVATADLGIDRTILAVTRRSAGHRHAQLLSRLAASRP